MKHRALPKRLVWAVPLAVVAGVTVAAPAEAHTALQGTTPPSGAAVAAFPGSVRLTFNEDVLDLGAKVKLAAPDGRAVPATSTTVSGSTVTATYPAARAAGVYRVSWRVVADDGHPVSGEYSFTSTATKAAPSSGTGGTAAAAPAGSGSPTTSGTTTAARSTRSGSSVPWELIGLGALAVVGVVGFRRVRGPR